MLKLKRFSTGILKRKEEQDFISVVLGGRRENEKLYLDAFLKVFDNKLLAATPEQKKEISSDLRDKVEEW